MRETEDHYFGAKGGKGVAYYLTSHVEAFDRKKAFALPVISMHEAESRRIKSFEFFPSTQSLKHVKVHSVARQ